MITHRLLTLALISTGTAQSLEVVPLGVGGSDANSSALAPGSSRDARTQILIDQALLGPARTLEGIEFRRDASYDGDYAGGRSHIQLTVSHSNRTSGSTLPDFDGNQADNPAERVLVFDGEVAIPASPTHVGRTVAWSDPRDRLRIAFTTPFVYTGGTLCLDFVSRQVAGSEVNFWAIDAAVDAHSGAINRIGTSCSPDAIPLANGALSSINANRRSLVAGSTFELRGLGRPGNTGAILVGFVPLQIELSQLNLAPAGCVLRVDPALSIVSGIPQPSAPLPVGRLRTSIQLPADASLLSAVFYAQFVDLGAVIHTSEALRCEVGAHIPVLGMSTVSARVDGVTLPTEGKVASNEAPVMRLTWR